MLANLMLMRDNQDQAMNTYMQLLEKQPDNYNALSQLVELLRRAGRLNEAWKYIEEAEKSSVIASAAGLAYIKGIYLQYTGESSKAVQQLNLARFDGFYGESAVTHMIEIYLNPANEMIWTAVGESEYSTKPENIQAAQDLIHELQQRNVDTTILECQSLIFTKSKQNLEQAEKRLKEMLSKSKDYVPALVNLALCKFIQKKSTDARNYLKTVLAKDF